MGKLNTNLLMKVYYELAILAHQLGVIEICNFVLQNVRGVCLRSNAM